SKAHGGSKHDTCYGEADGDPPCRRARPRGRRLLFGYRVFQFHLHFALPLSLSKPGRSARVAHQPSLVAPGLVFANVRAGTLRTRADGAARPARSTPETGTSRGSAPRSPAAPPR